MLISHVTAHHLSSIEGEVRLQLRSSELGVDESKEELLSRLKTSFLSRINRRHGHFSNEGDKSLLESLLNQLRSEDINLHELSSQFMRELEKQLKAVKESVDSHFLFFIAGNDVQQFFYLFVTTRGEALAIGDDLEVHPSYFVDTGVSLFGVKVDLNAWQAQPKSAYMTVIPPRGKPELAKLFDELCGFGDGVDKEEATLSFLKGVDNFAEQLPTEKVNEYRNKVVEYCVEQEKKDEPVSIAGLSKNLDGIDVDKFVREMLPHNPKGSDDVMIDRRSLKSYVRFYGRDKDITISFSSSVLNDRVSYDEQRDALVITNLPASLKKQLLKHLEE